MASSSRTEELGRLDGDDELVRAILPHCRLTRGGVWEDPVRGHRVCVCDADDPDEVARLFAGVRARTVINDPPYNVIVGGVKKSDALGKMTLAAYLEFSRRWVENAVACMADDADLFVWLGADYRDHFRPLPDFMVLMRAVEALRAKNYITVRNQRGYGTQKNWMWIRQELLHYAKGNPSFRVVYTDIPKVLKGYYKVVGGAMTENIERSRSETIRPGNVWIDIQQVFYRMEENVPGCYAQKPLSAIERIMRCCSDEGDVIGDFFAHSGSTLIAGERLGRRVITCDLDPVFAEIAIRRLERFRATGKAGWQWQSPFPEVTGDATESDGGDAADPDDGRLF